MGLDRQPPAQADSEAEEPDLPLEDLLEESVVLDDVDAPEDLSLVPELLAESLVESLPDSLPLLSAGFFLSEFLKSVSYQPVPFRRKAAADTCFRKPASPHSGQKTKGSSDIFCKASR